MGRGTLRSLGEAGWRGSGPRARPQDPLRHGANAPRHLPGFAREETAIAKAAARIPFVLSSPRASRTVLPDRARRCATLWLSPSQERRLGTQAPKRRRGPVERDCPGRNPGVRGVSGRLARRGPRDWDLLSNRDRRSRAHKHPGARPPAEETVPPGARVNRPGRCQARCRNSHTLPTAKAREHTVPGPRPMRRPPLHHLCRTRREGLRHTRSTVASAGQGFRVASPVL